MDAGTNFSSPAANHAIRCRPPVFALPHSRMPYSHFGTQSTYHVVNRASVGEVTELAEPPAEPEGGSALPDLPDVNREIVLKREERALAKAQADAANVNERVSMRDQSIFAALSKTMQCEWMEGPGNGGEKVQCILVMGAVRCARLNNRLAPALPSTSAQGRPDIGACAVRR